MEKENQEVRQLKNSSAKQQSSPQIATGMAFAAPPRQCKSNGEAISEESKEQDAEGEGKQISSGAGLPPNLKAGIESLAGFSMDDVSVHYNSSKPAAMNAHAFAQGNNIHLASGQEKHLPHEAWHVVQQKQGRVQPTVQRKGMGPVNDDSGLEKEADVMGAKAAQMAPDYNVVANSPSNTSDVVQKVEKDITTSEQTHIVMKEGKTLQKSTTSRSIPDGKLLKIDQDKGVLSRRGKNQDIVGEGGDVESSHAMYDDAERENVWYEIITYKGEALEGDWYILEGTFEDTKNKLMDHGLEEAKSFLLDDAGQQNQRDVFSHLDEEFEDAGVTDGNNGVLNLVISLDDEGELEMNIADGIRVGGTMVPFEGDIAPSVKLEIKTLVEGVLKGSDQWDYIQANKHDLINDDWSVVIDVDFYYSRNKSQTNFHMDTTGETLFTNLVYNDFNDPVRYGPEVISDLSFLSAEEKARLDSKVGGPDQFPGPISEDVLSTRYRSEGDDDPGKTKMSTGRIAPLNVVSFTDATSFHATPQKSNRFGDTSTTGDAVPDASEDAYIFLEAYKLRQEAMDRDMDGDLEDDSKADDFETMGRSTERRTFLRMWVQVMETSFVNMTAEVNDMIARLQAPMSAAFQTENKYFRLQIGLMGPETGFSVWIKKFKNKCNAAKIARADEIKTKDTALALKAKIQSLENLFLMFMREANKTYNEIEQQTNKRIIQAALADVRTALSNFN